MLSDRAFWTLEPWGPHFLGVYREWKWCLLVPVPWIPLPDTCGWVTGTLKAVAPRCGLPRKHCSSWDRGKAMLTESDLQAAFPEGSGLKIPHNWHLQGFGSLLLVSHPSGVATLQAG